MRARYLVQGNSAICGLGQAECAMTMTPCPDVDRPPLTQHGMPLTTLTSTCTANSGGSKTPAPACPPLLSMVCPSPP